MPLILLRVMAMMMTSTMRGVKIKMEMQLAVMCSEQLSSCLLPS